MVQALTPPDHGTQWGWCTQDCVSEEEEEGPSPEALSVDDLPNAADIKAMPFERQWRKVGALLDWRHI